MTPTIQAGSTLAPADLVVQCAALFWDFLAEHPEYAGALMREALEPDGAAADVVRANAGPVVERAVAYIDAARREGLIADLDTRRFLLRLATFLITFHAAPSMRAAILDDDATLAGERAAFLTRLGREVRPA